MEDKWIYTLQIGVKVIKIGYFKYIQQRGNCNKMQQTASEANIRIFKI